MKTFTKEDIYALLTANDLAVVRGLEALYLRQTADERSSETTKYSNGVGFSGPDANILSSFARQIAKWRAEKVETGLNQYPFPLSPKQLSLARYKVRKYAGQLADIANAKAAALDVERQAELAAERAAIQVEADEFETPVVGEPWSADRAADFDEFEDSHLSLA